MEPAPRRRSLRVRSRQALRPPEGRIAGGWWRQRPGRTDVTRRRGKRDREAAQEHPEATRQPPGWAQWGPPARLSPARDPHIATGARPAHPLTHAVGGEAGPPGGGAGSPACGCCNAPPDPTAAGQDAGSALTPLPHAPATTSAPAAARPQPVGQILTWPCRTQGHDNRHRASHQQPPESRDPALITGGPRPQGQQPIKSCFAGRGSLAPPLSSSSANQRSAPLGDGPNVSPAPPCVCPMGAALYATPPHRPCGGPGAPGAPSAASGRAWRGPASDRRPCS